MLPHGTLPWETNRVWWDLRLIWIPFGWLSLWKIKLHHSFSEILLGFQSRKEDSHWWLSLTNRVGCKRGHSKQISWFYQRQNYFPWNKRLLHLSNWNPGSVFLSIQVLAKPTWDNSIPIPATQMLPPNDYSSFFIWIRILLHLLEGAISVHANLIAPTTCIKKHGGYHRLCSDLWFSNIASGVSTSF